MTIPSNGLLGPKGQAAAELLRDVIGPQTSGQFAPKFTEAQRCEVLAFVLMGVSVPVIARAFGVNRRTVTHIKNPQSPHYKRTRNEVMELGRQTFIERYITEEGVAKIAAAKKDPEAAKPYKEHDVAKTDAINPRATKHAGMHTLKSGESSTVTIEIAYHEESPNPAYPEAVGWLWRDISDGPDTWLTVEDISAQRTSTAMLQAVKKEMYWE